ARRRDRLEQLVERMDDRARTLVVEADITDESAARAMVENTIREFGRLDIVINNAGVMLLGPIVDAPVEEWRSMVGINLLGLLYTTHAALPHLLRAAEAEPRRVADLVNVSSTAGRVARLGSGVYNATKFGVVAFTESLRQEVTRRHLRVSVVEPGAVMTELAGHNRPEVIEVMAATFGQTELMRSEDIAESILFTVTRPRHVAVNEVLVRPTEQER
ncbi:MAG: SDR family NAD(P)-dependent oxidoreductase, partial [Acidimicrobiales bacterium]